MRHLLPATFATLLLLAFCSAGGPRGEARIRAADLRADVSFLAADERGGRWLGEPGLGEAEEYVARSFASSGLVPLPDEEGHFLEFTLYGRQYDLESTYLELTVKDGGEPSLPPLRPELGVDFRPFDFSALGYVEGEVVFAGYGITAPEHDWDDYSGLDVKGKIVLVLRHQPREKDPDSPFGASGSEHALFASKTQNAERHGARAMLLATDPLHHRASDDLRLQPGLALDPGGARVSRGALPPRQLSFAALQISQELASRFAARAGRDLSEMQRAVDAGIKPVHLDLGAVRARLGVDLRDEASAITGRNVLAFLPGRDPELRDEWIVIGAHHDHVGSFSGEGDTVFNGADDNASGTAGVLALARAFASGKRPRRSLVFATFSAEERGLLGSRALVSSGRLPMDRVRFMVNLDMIGRNPDRPVEILGDGFAEGLRELVEEASRGLDLGLDFAGSRYSGNSDHDPFFEREIPFLFAFTGLHGDYHQISDHADKLAYEHMEQVVRLLYRSTARLANADQVPRLVHDVAWLGGRVIAGDEGVRVVDVDADSRALRLGLRRGDRLAADGETSGRATLRRLRQLQPGSSLGLHLERQGEERLLRMHRPRAGFLGVRIEGIDPELGRGLGLVRGEGVLVREVLDAGPARKAGLQAGDILYRLDGKRLGPANLVRVLEEIGAGESVQLRLARDEDRLTVAVTLAARP